MTPENTDDEGQELSAEEILPELDEAQKERLARKPCLSDFQRQKLEKDAKKNWNLFYKRNGDRFFKRRYWSRHEFQELFSDPSAGKDEGDATRPLRYLLEIGCGCGDFALPLLDEATDNPEQTKPKDLFIYCCDISNQAISILHNNPIYIKNHPSRIKAFVADISQNVEPLLSGVDGRCVHIVSLIFVLSALDPEKMKPAIENVRQVMQPGGLVLFRDYAIYDKAMLRFGDSSKICDQFYVRQDGTRAYFFRKSQLAKLFESSGFQCQSMSYVRRQTVNKATKDKFSRIFLQAKFRSPTLT